MNELIKRYYEWRIKQIDKRYNNLEKEYKKVSFLQDIESNSTVYENILKILAVNLSERSHLTDKKSNLEFKLKSGLK